MCPNRMGLGDACVHIARCATCDLLVDLGMTWLCHVICHVSPCDNLGARVWRGLHMACTTWQHLHVSRCDWWRLMVCRVRSRLISLTNGQMACGMLRLVVLHLISPLVLTLVNYNLPRCCPFAFVDFSTLLFHVSHSHRIRVFYLEGIKFAM